MAWAAVARAPLHPRRAEGTGKAEPRHLGTPCLAQKRLKPPRAVLRPKGSTSSARVDPCTSRTVRDVMGAGLCPPSQFGQRGEGSWQEPSQQLQGPDRLLGPWCTGSQGGHGEALPTQRWGIAGPAFLNDGLFGEPCPEVRACSGQPLGSTQRPSTLTPFPRGGDNPRPRDRQEEGSRPRLMAAQLLSGRMGLIRTTS